MTERPIILCDADVLRLLASQKYAHHIPILREYGLAPGHVWRECVCFEIDPVDTPYLVCEGRYGNPTKGRPGDVLWVREAHFLATGLLADRSAVVRYRADHAMRPLTVPDGIDFTHGLSLSKPRSPIHMPRWAARIRLEVTCVTAIRAQDISENGAVDEGMRKQQWERRYPGLWEQNVPVWAYAFNVDVEPYSPSE